MLDDGDGWIGEFRGQFKGGIGVIQVVVGQRFSLNLFCGRDTRACWPTSIERCFLVRVLTIAQFLKTTP